MLTDVTSGITLPLPESSGASVEAERCIAELQRGRAIVLTDASNQRSAAAPSQQVVQLVETLTAAEIEILLATQDCQLVLTRSRATVLKLMVESHTVCLDIERGTPASTVKHWAGLDPDPSTHLCTTSPLAGLHAHSGKQGELTDLIRCNNLIPARAALNLAIHAHVLPALIMYSVPDTPQGLLSVSTTQASAYSDQSGRLIRLSSARIPLATADSVELTVFRERHGNSEHVAITVGEPDFSNTVTVRLHSSCFTGDILASMKCDCGEQLQGAISSMAAGHGGVVLYIAQEGRGIGLASKLLAYQLQDKGLDTIDANQHLGFGADERRYSAAVYMLEQLGINDINLMTNNPLKIEALRNQGIKVSGRVPSPATVNVHNARYLETKRERAGHLSNCEIAG